MSVFREYAWGYDLLYRDKPYGQEAAFVDQLLMGLLSKKDRTQISILDLACGTGRHAIEWLKQGYVVEGSEPSDEMRQQASEHSRKAPLSLLVHPYSFQQCDRIGKTFDVVTSMFGSIGYLADSGDLRLGLRNIHGLVRPGGYFLFDFWSGLAVPNHYSPTKVLELKDGTRSLVRISRTQLEPFHSVAEVEFDLLLIEDERIRSRSKETHRVRYFLPREIEDHLEAAGFELVQIMPFMAPERKPNVDDWNLTVVARKKA